MNKKYKKYINYIVSDIEAPYFINMRDNYGLSEKEYELVLSKIFNQPVRIKGNDVYNTNGNQIYSESSDGYWIKREYNTNGKEIYYETSSGVWIKREYDTNGNNIYYETSDGYWVKQEYNIKGNQIYYEESDGTIIDNR